MIELVNFLSTDRDEQFQTLGWRNSPDVAQFFQIKHIEEKTHERWLDSLMDDNPRTIAFFIRFNDVNIGVAYFHSIDYVQKECDWGIYIRQEDFRSKGIGGKVLEESIRYAKSHLGMDRIFLEVLQNNQRAQSVYEKKGFILKSANKDVLRYALELNS